MPLRQLTALILFSLLLLASAPLRAADPLDKQVPLTYRAGNFRHAVSEIQATTGFAVQCPKDVADFMATLPCFAGISYPYGDAASKTLPVRRFLDVICGQMAMAWTFDPATKTVTLDHPWHSRDPRSARELITSINSVTFPDDPPIKGLPDNLPDILALLGKPGNVDLAWKPLQASFVESTYRNVDLLHRALVSPVIATDLQRYTFILIEQPIERYPGQGSATWFLLRDDGTLASAGAVNTGWRCQLASAVIAPIPLSMVSPSELEMALKWNNLTYLIARFHIARDGLKLLSLVDAHGEPFDPKDISLGYSLLPE